jgi:Fe-S-cluster-containing hydrogenase component 2
VKDGAAIVDAAACMGCGVCVSKCTQGALSLVRDPARGEPLEILNLLQAVNLREVQNGPRRIPRDR